MKRTAILILSIWALTATALAIHQHGESISQRHRANKIQLELDRHRAQSELQRKLADEGLMHAQRLADRVRAEMAEQEKRATR